MPIRPYLSVLLASLLVSSMAHAQQPMTDDELKSMLVGHSSAFSDGGLARYRPDGTYSFTAPNGKIWTGKWSIAGGRVCYDFEQGGSRCDKYFRDTTGPYLINSRGNQYRFTTAALDAVPASSPATTLKVCEQTVSYSVHQPTPDVPAGIRAFSGAWTGKWDMGLCAALIVESVSSNGAARIAYVNGSFNQYGIRPATNHWAAKIVGNTLTSSGRSATLEFTSRSEGELAGRFTSQYGQNSGTFTKQ